MANPRSLVHTLYNHWDTVEVLVRLSREFAVLTSDQVLGCIAKVSPQLDAEAQGAALRLQSILAPYMPGNCPVRLTYRNKEAVCELNLGDASRVRLEDDLLLSLSDWLSSENVSIEYN